jgi:23S rRNA pseudouridine1911/1915/1917 synthase
VVSGPTYRLLHRDETLLAVDKAAGVLTVGHPGSRERCLLDDLRRDGHAVAPVHRLDRETSGVLLLSLDPAWRAALEQAFRRHDVQREYLALVERVPAARRASIDVPILDEGKSARVDRGGRRALTHYEVIESFAGKAALVRAVPETGRHNQIRIHLAHIGHPVLGDRKYGRRGKGGPARVLLHAERLGLKHPRSGRRLDFRAPLPDDFARACEELRAGRWPGG